MTDVATLARLSVAVVLGQWDALRALRAAGEPDRAWREALLQAHLFCGFPRVVEAFGVLHGAGGLGEPASDEVLGEPDRPQRGARLFDAIYAERADDVRALLERGHPDFAAWIAGHAYGRVLTRPGLEARERELLAVACLAALGQERQLASHVRGALRVGARRSEVFDVLASIADLVRPERLALARRVAERFAPAEGQGT